MGINSVIIVHGHEYDWKFYHEHRAAYFFGRSKIPENCSETRVLV